MYASSVASLLCHGYVISELPAAILVIQWNVSSLCTLITIHLFPLGFCTCARNCNFYANWRLINSVEVSEAFEIKVWQFFLQFNTFSLTTIIGAEFFILSLAVQRLIGETSFGDCGGFAWSHIPQIKFAWHFLPGKRRSSLSLFLCIRVTVVSLRQSPLTRFHDGTYKQPVRHVETLWHSRV